MVNDLVVNALVYLGFLLAIGIVAWLGQWGRTNRFARYGVLAVIGLVGVFFLMSGAFFMAVLQIPIYAWLCGGISLVAFASLVPPLRRGLSKTVFPGLDVSVPAHTWALFIFLAMMLSMVFLITVLFNPDVFVESLKDFPLPLMALLNVVSFVVFSFLAAGVGIYKPLGETIKDLGLTRLPWKTVLQMLGVALALAILIQVLESVLMPFVDVHMREILQKIVEAFKTTGGVQETLMNAVIVGLAAGIGEEILFRGLMQPVFGIVPTALLFTLIHVHYGPTVILLELLIVGIILGIIRQRYNTTAAIIVHAAFDFFALSSSLLPHP